MLAAVLDKGDSRKEQMGNVSWEIKWREEAEKEEIQRYWLSNNSQCYHKVKATGNVI